MTVCAVVSGADAWTDVETYGLYKQPRLETFLGLPNGIPSHDTLGRVFAALAPASFRRYFIGWMRAVVEASRGRLVAIPGKALRHSFDTAKGKSALHLVSAWASANHLLPGQCAVDEEPNEITAIAELLKLLDLQGALMTIDAMGCQKRTAADTTAAGGDYVRAVKANQPGCTPMSSAPSSTARRTTSRAWSTATTMRRSAGTAAPKSASIMWRRCRRS